MVKPEGYREQAQECFERKYYTLLGQYRQLEKKYKEGVMGKHPVKTTLAGLFFFIFGSLSAFSFEFSFNSWGIWLGVFAVTSLIATVLLNA